MNILITICARGGSKGIPGKNIKSLNGKPLIAYTIETAQNFAGHYSTVIGLSTDEKEIKEVAKKFGLKTEYERPKELATDQAGKIEVIADLKKYEEDRLNIEFDYIIDLDVTSPLRTTKDLIWALQMLEAKKDAYNIFSVSPAGRNPYFNMVEEREDGFVQLVKKRSEILSRQAAPPVYDMNASFYIFRPSFFEVGFQSSITDKSLAYIVPHICFDLDHPHDFTIMELMIQQNLLDFEL